MIGYLIVAAVLAVGGAPLAICSADSRGDAVARVVTALVMAAAWPITIICVACVAIGSSFIDGGSR